MLRFIRTECIANSGPERNSWRVVDARGSLPACQGDSFDCTLAHSIRHYFPFIFAFLLFVALYPSILLRDSFNCTQAHSIRHYFPYIFDFVLLVALYPGTLAAYSRGAVSTVAHSIHHYHFPFIFPFLVFVFISLSYFEWKLYSFAPYHSILKGDSFNCTLAYSNCHYFPFHICLFKKSQSEWSSFIPVFVNIFVPMLWMHLSQ